jgi:probable O-glycosylation ligase (exosortase A-associated)
MRDIALTLVFGLLLLAVFKHPVIGAYLWAWVSLMNPHKMTYGFAFTLPFAQTAAAVTLLMYVASNARRLPPMNAIVGVQLAMLGWMVVSSAFALAPMDVVLDRVVFVAKIHVMLFVTWALVTEAKHLKTLISVVTLSVAFFGIKGGIWTVLTGGGNRVWGPPGGMLEGNNELAVGLVMLLPMLYFMRQTSSLRWLRHALTLAMVCVTFSILGSQSRGALLALLSMAFFLGLKGKHPVRTSLVLLAGVALAVAFMPDSWSERMDTMRTYQTDGSAMSRIWTWNTMLNAALDRPLIGVGFGADSHEVFERYAPRDEIYAIFQGSVYVAHSIYFQMLGEHGFVGLALFLVLGLVSWRVAGRVGRQSLQTGVHADWIPLLMRMVQVSLIGYAVGGTFLSIAYLDLPYYIIGFAVLADDLLRRETAKAPRAAAVRPVQAVAR